ncbi:MAG: hemolysin [Myxococcaceae bacterium]|nr:hemolysin [Myxococcaceae bacterium]
MSTTPFRQEAVDHHAGGADEADVLRFDRRWTRVTYTLLKVAAVVAFAYASLFSVDEYASGPAVVRVDGRRMITATSPGTVEDVLVHPGQEVAAGAVLVRMHGSDEAKELERATVAFEADLSKMLRDPSDIAAKQALTGLRAQKDQAKNMYDARTTIAPIAGVVSDVRVRPGQHVAAGEVLVAVAPKDTAQVSLVAMVPAEFRPMLKPGLKMRFELDGFRYEYADLTVVDVSAEAVGPAEVQRYLGQERFDAVHLDPGAKVLVTATLPSSTFTSEGNPYGYFDGLTGTAEIRVRSEPILVTLVPALRRLFPGR